MEILVFDDGLWPPILMKTLFFDEWFLTFNRLAENWKPIPIWNASLHRPIPKLVTRSADWLVWPDKQRVLWKHGFWVVAVPLLIIVLIFFERIQFFSFSAFLEVLHYYCLSRKWWCGNTQFTSLPASVSLDLGVCQFVDSYNPWGCMMYDVCVYGGFHSHGGTPIAGWFISWTILLKWMMTGGTLISGHHHMDHMYIPTATTLE